MNIDSAKLDEDPEDSCKELCRLMSLYPDFNDELWEDLMFKSRDLPEHKKREIFAIASAAGVPEPARTLLSDDGAQRQHGLPESIDLILYVALTEESAELFNLVVGGLKHEVTSIEHPNAALTLYLTEIGERRIAIVNGGGMGSDKAAAVTGRLQSEWSNADVVVLGIAGAVSSDFLPGDVFVPYSVKGYIENAAAVDANEAFAFMPSGKEIPCSPRLLDRVNRLKLAPELHDAFENLKSRLSDRVLSHLSREMLDELRGINLDLSEKGRLISGDDKKLGSGPIVGKSNHFVGWIKDLDRKISAIEMESVGVAIANQLTDPAPRFLAIRGISDVADSRKNEIEDICGDAFRRAALENAVEVFVSLLKSGLFEPSR